MSATERAMRIEGADDAGGVRSQLRRARRPVVFGEAASDAFQARFSLPLQVVGSADPDAIPRLDGPRHCGQF